MLSYLNINNAIVIAASLGALLAGSYIYLVIGRFLDYFAKRAVTKIKDLVGFKPAQPSASSSLASVLKISSQEIVKFSKGATITCVLLCIIALIFGGEAGWIILGLAPAAVVFAGIYFISRALQKL